MRIKVKPIEIKQSRLFDPVKLNNAIEGGLNETALEVRAEFLKTTATWEHTVVFNIIFNGEASREISTDSQQYGFVSGGTKAHLIYPGPGGVLKFRNTYSVKTMPRVLGSLAGGSSGGDVFTKLPVLHPGTEPREFDKVIAKKYIKKFAKKMQAAVKSGLK